MNLNIDGVLRLELASEQTITSILNRLSAIKGQLDRIEAKLVPPAGAPPPHTGALAAATAAAKTAEDELSNVNKS